MTARLAALDRTYTLARQCCFEQAIAMTDVAICESDAGMITTQRSVFSLY
jgi:hypothetical protein